MTTQPNIHIIGAASGIAANNHGCSMGPLVLQTSPYLETLPLNFEWEATIYAPQSDLGLAALPAVAHLNEQIAEYTYTLTQQQQTFMVFGGDHSCAIGTWSGAAAAVSHQGPLGLIWIDAHMDSHTPQTSLSKNIHGMPLASLLGYGPPEFTHIKSNSPKLLPQHICLIGVRSFEKGEAELLKSLGVRIFFMDEVQQKGLKTVMQEALTIATRGTANYGISIDLDAVDPEDAPAVGKAEKNGVRGEELCAALKMAQQYPKLTGIEIAEFNPNLDSQHKTEKLIGEIVQAIFVSKKDE